VERPELSGPLTPIREHDRLVVVSELRKFDDGEATYGELVWALRKPC
jgi:hypothetical protein